MKFIIKTLLLAPSAKKLFEYQSKFASVFRERDALFDAAYAMISDYYRDYETFPAAADTIKFLHNDGDGKLAVYIEGLISDTNVPTHEDDSGFFFALEQQEQDTALADVFSSMTAAQQGLANKRPGIHGVIAPIDDLLVGLHQIKAKLGRGEASTASLLYGAPEDSGHNLRDIYGRIKTQQDTSNAAYYDIGISHFKKASVKPGDLIFLGGFTSHGKSVIARYITYHLLTHYGLNCAFFSKEMSHDAVRVLFALLHANNKEIFPNTPYITYDAWKEGTLTPEEEDFLFNFADHDLRTNSNYGTLYLDQPNKTKYRLSDLQAKLVELETQMPIHAVIVDYITLLYPRETDKGQPDMSDYNEMIKAFKNLAISHRNYKGEPAPFIAITPAQISRFGLAAAIKNENLYEISAFAQYSEIDRSADHLFTVLMTPEMAASKRMRVQHHKGRDTGVVLDPADVFVDLDRGFGINEVAQQSDAEVVDQLKRLSI